MGLQRVGHDLVTKEKQQQTTKAGRYSKEEETLLEIPKISGDRLSSRGWKRSVPLFCYSLGCGCDWRQLGLQVNSEIKWRKLMEKQ